jgi:hypothetical protein
MTYSGDRSNPGPNHAGPFAAPELSAEDLERLATTFHPSWELDEAPFGGPAAFSAAEVRTLQGSPQVREGLRAAANEGLSTGRISAGSAARRAAPSQRSNAEPRFVARPIAESAPLTAEDFVGSLYAPRFKKAPLIGVGVIAIVLVVLAIWATSSSDSKSSAPSEATGSATQPAPPAVTQATAPLETEPAISATPSSPEGRASALPLPTRTPPEPQVLGRVPALAPSRAPLPGAKPTARPKVLEPTIVHEVPF